MELKLSSAQDDLLNSLNYKMPKTASYILKRDVDVKYHPTGSSVYSPSGNRHCKILLSDPTAWIDPSTVHLAFRITNKHASVSYNLYPAWTAIKRMTLRAGGKIIEDINNYGVLHQLVSKLTNEQRHADELMKAGVTNVTRSITSTRSSNFVVGKHHEVCFRPFLSLFNSSVKLLPVRFMPIELEIEFSANAEDLTNDVNGNVEFDRVELRCDNLQMDGSLNEAFASHLASGKSLEIPLSCYFNNSQFLSGSDVAINISRAISRLKALFVCPSGIGVNPNHNFTGFSDASDGLKIQFRSGATLLPQEPISSTTQLFYHLQKTISHHYDLNNSTTFDLNEWFLGNTSVIAIDLEKSIDGVSFTGMNSKSGELLQVLIRSDNTVDRHYNTFVNYDCILSISRDGLEVFE